MPFFIRHLTTSAPVFFIRFASSPTEISSGILTVRGVFLAISNCNLRSFSCSSCLRLLEKFICCCFFLPPALRNFSLFCSMLPRLPRSLVSAISCNFSSYLSRLILVALRVSTTFVLGTREALDCSPAVVAGVSCFAVCGFAVCAEGFILLCFPLSSFFACSAASAKITSILDT